MRSIITASARALAMGLLLILAASCGGRNRATDAGRPGSPNAVSQRFELEPGDQAAPMAADTTGYAPGYNTSEESREEYAHRRENSFHSATSEPLSTFSIDVDAASYSNVRRMINEGRMPEPDAVRVEEMINYFTYDYPQPRGNEPFSITTDVASCPWNPEHRLVQIGLQGARMEMDELPPNNLVFLIDVSGSMDQPNKLPLLKASLQQLALQLRPSDRVSIVVYAGAAGLVLPPTRGDQTRTIVNAINSLNAGGSTAGGEGIQLAYHVARETFIEHGNNRVILATDGDFNVGVRSEDELERLIERERGSGVFLSVLGFGVGNLKDAKMELLADKGNGHYAYIDGFAEATKVMVNEIGATLYTIAKDVKIQVEFNPEFVDEYRLVGYENRRLADRDFNDDTKDAGELGAGHTVTALYEVVPAGRRARPDVDPLKYQRGRPGYWASTGGELMTVKLRYKQPQGDVSRLLTTTINDNGRDIESASENLRFASAVAEWGMLLRDSRYSGDASFESVLRRARDASGRDEHGYRSEFVTLVEKSRRLARTAM